MKMIYLLVDGEGWKPFNRYDTKELSKRGIHIGWNACIGDYVRISNGVTIRKDVGIGNHVLIGENTLIGINSCIQSVAFLGPNITVGDCTLIGEYSRLGAEITVGDCTRIGEYSRLGSEITVGDCTRIGEYSIIELSTRIGNRCHIPAYSRISARAKIGNGERTIAIHLAGSRFRVSYWGEDRIAIGCQHLSIDQWLSEGVDIAKQQNFTVEQIEEYRTYVEFIKSIHTMRNPNDAGYEASEAAQGGGVR
ncbi:MAG: hypothetical protein LBQ30_03040 [Treponema sp.]|jgi:UDP-3-O-[3-hydroxymyristoyl] glucosamine N-acyltransferase|nr:hypothetical protein [Treponema sp.]